MAIERIFMLEVGIVDGMRRGVLFGEVGMMLIGMVGEHGKNNRID